MSMAETPNDAPAFVVLVANVVAAAWHLIAHHALHNLSQPQEIEQRLQGLANALIALEHREREEKR